MNYEILKQTIRKIKEVDGKLKPNSFKHISAEIIDASLCLSTDENFPILDRIRFLLADYDLLYNYNIPVKDLFEKFLLKPDGTVSAQYHHMRYKDLIYRLIQETKFLPIEATIPQRWYHLKNNILDFIKCKTCDNLVKWKNGYSNSCHRTCWHKSDIGRISLSKNMYGKSMPKEAIEKSAKSRTGIKWNDERKIKHSVKMKGNTNFLKNGTSWNKGLPPEKQPCFGIIKTGLLGELNPMFGKTPSKYCGFGIQGYYKERWFRSSLELFWLMYWDNFDYTIESGEIDKYRVNYEYNGTIKSYTPDFIVNEVIYEIKPISRINEEVILTKFNALKHKFGDNVRFGTEIDISDFISRLTMDDIDAKIDNEVLNVSDKQYHRLFNALYNTNRNIIKHFRNI